ncbi:hypothetical protein ACK3TF_002189 [Chlorella vulgaris]
MSLLLITGGDNGNGKGGRSVGTVAYAVGVALMAVVAISLVVFSFLLRRRYRRRAALLAAYQEQQMAAVATREAEAMEEAACRAQRAGVVPVVIMQPDGDIILAEKLNSQDGSTIKCAVPPNGSPRSPLSGIAPSPAAAQPGSGLHSSGSGSSSTSQTDDAAPRGVSIV